MSIGLFCYFLRIKEDFPFTDGLKLFFQFTDPELILQLISGKFQNPFKIN